MNYQEIKKFIPEIEFKDGSTRSLAMSLSSFIDVSYAWQFAREVTEKYGKEFEKKDVIEFLNSAENQDLSFTSGTSINSKIRQHLSEGKTVSEVAKLLSISYQRAKNVQKKDAKKLLAN